MISKNRKKLEDNERPPADSESNELSKLINLSAIKRQPGKDSDFVYLKQRVTDWKKEMVIVYL